MTASAAPSRRGAPARRALRPWLLLAALAAPACSLTSSTDGLRGGNRGGEGGRAGVGAAGAGGAAGGAAAGGAAGGAAAAGGGAAGGAAGAAGCVDATACGLDLRNDRANCGAIGHDCLGGACEAGACQPVAIVRGQEGVIGVAVNERHLFWANQQTKNLWRAGLDGSNAAVIVAGEPTDEFAPVYVAVRGDALYWTEQGAGQKGRIARADLNGAGFLVLVENEAAPTGIAVDDESIFFTTYLDPGEVRKAPVGGGVAEPIASGLHLPEGIAFFEGELVVAQFGTGTITSLATDGSSVASFSSNLIVSPAGVAADERFVYWANQDQNVLYRVDFTSTPRAPTPLTAGTGRFTGVAVDDRAIYWSAIDDGIIYRLAK